MVLALVFGLGSCHIPFLCSNRFIIGIDYHTRREVFVSLQVYFIDRFCIGFMVLVLYYS